MKILVCSSGFLPADQFGGPPYSTYYLCKALARAGARVSVITTDRNGAKKLDVATDCWSEFQGLPVWYAKTGSDPFIFAPSSAKVIDRAISEVDCVLNSGTLWTYFGLLSWRGTQRHNKASLTYLRGLLDPWAFRFKAVRKKICWNLIGKRILQDTSAIVALNENERQNILDLGIENRIEVIPNGATVDADVAVWDRSTLEDKIPVLRHRRYVLFLGRIHEKKGLDILLPAIGDLSPQLKETMFVVAGPIDPSYSAKFTEMLGACSLHDRIILTGSVNGRLKSALLKFADLFVLPSYSEGLPVAVLEALSSGCPVVVTRQCNLPEVSAFHAGLEIAPDRLELASAINRLLIDEDSRRDMARNSLRLARDKFNWEAIGVRTLSLCEEVTRLRGGVDRAFAAR